MPSQPQIPLNLPVCFWRPRKDGFNFDVNFGDELFEWIAEALLGKDIVKCHATYPGPKFLPGGSLFHRVTEGSVVWGVGVHRNDRAQRFPKSLQIHAVRGPLTRQFLLSSGVPCPDVIGDPVLLLADLFPCLKTYTKKKYKIGVVPHFSDMELVHKRSSELFIIDPRRCAHQVVPEILSCEKIISSSLHGIIVAEIFGIPACWLRLSEREPAFKFFDYYASTERKNMKPIVSFERAQQIAMQDPPDFTQIKADLFRSFPFIDVRGTAGE